MTSLAQRNGGADTPPMGTENSEKARRLSLELRDKTRRDLALAEIGSAIEATEGNAVHAAERLGVSHRSMMRWIAEHPKLELRVRQIRERYGHPHEVGEPARRKT